MPNWRARQEYIYIYIALSSILSRILLFLQFYFIQGRRPSGAYPRSGTPLLFLFWALY